MAIVCPSSAPLLFQCSHPNAFFQPHLHQGGCCGGGRLRLYCRGCCGACSTPFSRLLQPSVRCVEDLGVVASGHRPLPSQSLCGRVSLPDGDHSVCAPVGASGGLGGLHRSEGSVPSSAGSSSFSSLLRFLFRDTVYQFKALCFGLSTAPQVFTRVMAPVSAMLHSMGIRMRRYLDDWLVSLPLGSPSSGFFIHHRWFSIWGLSSTPPLSGLLRRRSTSHGCSQQPQSFQSCASPPTSLWLSLLGVLSSLAHLVPGGRLSIRSLQLCLHRSWDRQDLEDPMYASMECLRGLQWWLHLPRLSLGVSLCQVSPDPHFWSDASDVGWGAHLHRKIASGLWDAHQAALSITARELLAVQLGLHQFQSSLQGPHGGCILRQHHSGGLSSQGGWHKISSPQHLGSGVLALDGVPLHPPGSAIPPGLQQRPRGRPVSPSPAPTFRVVTKPDRISLFEKTLAGPNRFICHLGLSSLFDLLLTIPGSNVSRHGRVSPVLGRSSGLRVPSGGHHSACSREAQGLHGDGAHTSSSSLGPAPSVLRPAPAFAGSSSDPAGPSRPLALASVSSSLPGSPSAQASCLATLQRFTRAAGFSSAVAEQYSLARRPS